MAILLGALVSAFAIPAWAAAMKYAPLPARARSAVTVFTVAAAEQLLFIIFVAPRRLDYSLTFAAGGVLGCLVATVLAITNDAKSPVSRGVVISSLLSFSMWLFLITLH